MSVGVNAAIFKLREISVNTFNMLAFSCALIFHGDSTAAL